MPSPADRALSSIRDRSRPGAIRAAGVDVHFHPDALAGSGGSVLERLVVDGRWRTQFETGTSNGGLTAFRGGDRWRWESRLFGTAYDEADPAARPAYGALRMDEAPHGAAPRFGSCFLRLRPAVLARSSLCFPDSVYEPDAVGTVDAAGSVLDELDRRVLEDPLDRYVEVHVHGGVDLHEDLEAIVLDPSFRGTSMVSAASAAGLRVEWHPGYALAPDRLPGSSAYRGGGILAAAARISGGRPITPAMIGAARASGGIDLPTAKRVWHLVAAFGRRSDAAFSGGSAAPA